MKLRSRKLIGTFVLFAWLIVFALVAMGVMSALPRPPFLVELVIYVVLGFIWIFPLKRLFIWMGKAPDRYDQPDPKRP